MDKKIFSELTSDELKTLYAEILKAREEGLRPRVLDKYIRQVQAIYPLTFGEAWKHTEQLFWEEAAKRFFEQL